MTLIWELEVIQQRDTTLYIAGWLYDTRARTKELHLELLDSQGRVVGRVPLAAGKPRPDVAGGAQALPVQPSLRLHGRGRLAPQTPTQRSTAHHRAAGGWPKRAGDHRR